MAHFAELDEDNIVIRVLVIPDEQEDRGQEFLSVDLGLGGRWEKTSYNTHFGVYCLPGTKTPAEDQSKAFRKNYAGIGYFYDESLDAFILPKPEEHPSWIIDEQTGDWKPPIPMPEIGGPWEWNEEIQNWQEVTSEE